MENETKNLKVKDEISDEEIKNLIYTIIITWLIIITFVKRAKEREKRTN